jgi:hypothetical protein
MSRQLNLDIRTQGQLMHGDTSPHGLRRLGEHLLVDFVHGREVFHVGEEDVDFHDLVRTRVRRRTLVGNKQARAYIVNTRPRGIENGAEVRESLCLWVLSARVLCSLHLLACFFLPTPPPHPTERHWALGSC